MTDGVDSKGRRAPSRWRQAFPRGPLAGLAAALVVLLAAVVTACGDSSSEPSGTGSASSGGAPAGCDLKYAQDEIKKYSSVPKFTPPGPAFDAKKAAGKSIYTIPIFSQLPFIENIDNLDAKLAKELGIGWKIYPNQGKTTEWVQGMEAAIAARPDLINLAFAPEPKLLKPQIEKARGLGIPSVATHWYDVDDANNVPANTIPDYLAANVPSEFTKHARLEVDWAIAKSKCDAHMVFLYAAGSDVHKQMFNAAKDEMEKVCGSSCSMIEMARPYPWDSSRIQADFQTAMAANPEVNWLLPDVDVGAPFAEAAIRAAGKTGKVKIATSVGNPAVVKAIADGDIVDMNVAESQTWLGYAYMDQFLRVMLGLDPVKDEKIGFRIFSDENVKEAGKAPFYPEFYGEPAAEDGYRKLWGLNG